MVSGALRGVYVTTIGAHANKQWNGEALNRWITNLGGHFLHSKFTDDTTHLVMSQKDWTRQGNIVQQALEAKNFQGRNIRFVSWDWLSDCLENSKKKKEGAYDWLKMDAAAAKQQKKAQRDEPKTVQGMMRELFTEETDKYITDADRKQFEKQAAEERQAKREQEEEQKRVKKEAMKMSREELTAVFKHGAKRARNEIFSENHHVFADRTGFKYDITLTKTLVQQNRNERLVLTMYESNAEPYTYAMNAQSAATGKHPQNDIVLGTGTNFETTFRRFKKEFEERTGVQWDDRIKVAVERAKKMKAERARRMALGSEVEDGSVGLGHGRGALGSGGHLFEKTQKRKTFEEMARDRAEEEKKFKLAPFDYHPPTYGPRGLLPDHLANEYPDAEDGREPSQPVLGDAMSKAKMAEIASWMRFANDPDGMPPPFSLNNRAATEAVTEFDFSGMGGREYKGPFVEDATEDGASTMGGVDL